MRKLIAMLAVCAGAMGLHAATTGTSFEGLIPEGAESTNYVDVLGVAAAELSGTPGQYWNVNAENVDTLVDEFIVTTNYGETAVYGRARNSSLSGNTEKSFLTIATKKNQEVTRYAQTSHEAVAIANNGSYYFDSLVQFTAFETNKFANEVLGDYGKMAIWLQAGDFDSDLNPTTTNLIVSAGYLASNGTGGYKATQTNYVCKIVGANPPNIFDGGWHRVTVKAFDNIYTGYNVPAFAIAIDGIAVEITNDIASAGIDTSLLTSRAAKYYENNQKLFPSAKVGDKTVASASFQGVGSVDDLVFSDVADISWMIDDTFTVELGANVTSAVYSVNGGASVEITADTEISYEENMVVTISNIGYADGYMKLGCGPADTGVAIVTNAASYEVTVSAANKTVTIDAQTIGATIVDNSATPVVTPCATAADAFLAICTGMAGDGPFTVTLGADATEGIELLGYNEVTLDLAGNSIYAGEKSAAITVGEGMDVGVSLTIEDSVGGGSVVGDSSEGVSAVLVDCGTLVINGGTYEGLVNADPDAGNVFTVTGEGVKFTKADVDDNDTYDYTLAAVVAGLGSDYGLGVSGDYYVVQAVGGGGLDPESGITTVEVTAESAADAEDAAKADITVPDGSGVDPSDYAEYFKYGVESIGVNTYEVSITGIVETIEVSVAESAVQRLTDSEATYIEIPDGLYYRITPSTDLPISGTSQTGLSTGSVTIGKPGTDKGFYKVELNATPFPVVAP